MGKKFFGKTNRKLDQDSRFESYDSTLWFVALWFPIFPIATYTVRRHSGKWLRFTFAPGPLAIERHARNWEQIFSTWIKAVLVLWAIILVVRHAEWLAYLLKRI